MAAHGELGIELDLDRVPLREATLTPYEILLSESQERMLIVCERGREAELAAVFEKWDLHAAVIGRITQGDRWRVKWHGKLVADIPVKALADQAPMYDRPAAEPKRASARPLEMRSIPAPRDALRKLLDSPNVASKKWVYRQYDSMVLSNTIVGPGCDAAVIRIKGSRRGIAMKVDSNPRACAIDPYIGAVATVVEAARNVACAGAQPVGITNCLNYGNPERPEVMWQFVRGVEGLRDAALALGAPVVSGNVSFYNETEGRAIPPTPTIAVVGLLTDASRHVKSFFTRPGPSIVMVRTAQPNLAASEYAALFGAQGGTLAPVDLARESALIGGLVAGAELGLIGSAHDVSDGGLAVTIAEACGPIDGPFNLETQLGAQIDESPSGDDLAIAAALFGEGPSTVILSVAPEHVSRVVSDLFPKLECRVIGRVIAEPRLRIGSLIDEDLAELRRIYEMAIPRRLGG
jgi:phosphoribosylformylglycinamidine synthase